MILLAVRCEPRQVLLESDVMFLAQQVSVPLGSLVDHGQKSQTIAALDTRESNVEAFEAQGFHPARDLVQVEYQLVSSLAL